MQGSTNQIDIEAPLERVAAVLRDPRTYPEWLVGAQAIRSIDDGWPAVGSKFHHRIGVGPLAVPGSTTVRRDEPRELVLGAGMGPFGEAKVVFTLEPTAQGVHVTVEEEPRAGAARLAWKVLRPVVTLGLWGRNEVSLESLRDVVLDRAPSN